jgi:hypothetical protein
VQGAHGEVVLIHHYAVNRLKKPLLDAAFKQILGGKKVETSVPEGKVDDYWVYKGYMVGGYHNSALNMLACLIAYVDDFGTTEYKGGGHTRYLYKIV